MSKRGIRSRIIKKVKKEVEKKLENVEIVE